MMEDISEMRISKLDLLMNFTNKTLKDVDLTINSLGLNHDSIQEVSNKSVCQLNSSHLISPPKYEAHSKRCEITSKGYCFEELLPNSCDNRYSTTIDSSLCSLILAKAAANDSNFKSGILPGSKDCRPIPLSSSCLAATYTGDERRAIYDYVIENVSVTPEICEEQYPVLHGYQELSGSKSKLEELAQNRDMKRRRTKYKVSTKSKTHTEVIREVIQNQMSVYSSTLHLNSKSSYSNKSAKTISDQNMRKNPDESNITNPTGTKHINHSKNDFHKPSRSHNSKENTKRKNS